MKILCFPDTTFPGGSESDSREVLAGVSLDADNSSSSIREVLQPLWHVSQQVSLFQIGLPILLLSLVPVESRNWIPSGELSAVEFCGHDVGDVLVFELERDGW